MILDRLQVQDPQGKTLDGYLQSLRTVLSSKENIVLVLLERLSKQPSQVGFRVFSALGDLFQGKELSPCRQTGRIPLPAGRICSGRRSGWGS